MEGTKQFTACTISSRPDITVSDITDAATFILDRVEENIEDFGAKYPAASSDNLQYELTDMVGWTPSFWSGLLWIASDLDGGSHHDVALQQLDEFETRLETGNTDTHDLGFLYSLSAVACYKRLGNERARQVALDAARHLTDRYWSEPGIIQAWGDPHNPDASDRDRFGYGRTIIDTMMNLPLLFWASETTGDSYYRRIANSHAHRTRQHLVREDGSTYHTYLFDVETGDAIIGETDQGYDDDSCWSRGQAWAIYGFTVAARYTGDERFLETAQLLADWYIQHLPEDLVPYWDFDAPEKQVRDSSAAAIAASGLLELADATPVATSARQRYENTALATIESLTESYTTVGIDSNGILKEATYNKNNNDYDECCIWGDYFYSEALAKALNQWTSHW